MAIINLNIKNNIRCHILCKQVIINYVVLWVWMCVILLFYVHPPFPLLSYFFRGCVFEMVVLPYFVIYYLYISGTLGSCFNYWRSVYWCSVYGIWKRSDTLWPAGRVRLFADYTISFSSLCRLIWWHWTKKNACQVYAAECVSKIETILAIIFHSMYGAMCLQLNQFSCDDCENVYLILLSSSNRKYDTLTIV